MLMFCLFIWGSSLFQYQNSITEIGELQGFYAEHISALSMCCPVVFGGTAKTHLEKFTKVTLRLKANGLGNFSNGKRRVC